MTTIRTVLKDNFDTELQIQGARSQNSNDDIASVAFLNFDNDTSNIFRMAEIVMRDYYGNYTSNGYGNMIFKTSSSNGNIQDRMMLTSFGNLGVNYPYPDARLCIGGDAKINNIYTSNIFASNIVYKNEPTFYPVTNNQITYNVFTKMFSWVYNGSESNIRTIKDVGVRSSLRSFDSRITSNLNYTLRVYDTLNNKTIGSMLFSNINPEVCYIPLSNIAKVDNVFEIHAKKGASGDYINVDGVIIRYI